MQLFAEKCRLSAENTALIANIQQAKKPNALRARVLCRYKNGSGKVFTFPLPFGDPIGYLPKPQKGVPSAEHRAARSREPSGLILQ